MCPKALYLQSISFFCKLMKKQQKNYQAKHLTIRPLSLYLSLYLLLSLSISLCLSLSLSLSFYLSLSLSLSISLSLSLSISLSLSFSLSGWGQGGAGGGGHGRREGWGGGDGAEPAALYTGCFTRSGFMAKPLFEKQPHFMVSKVNEKSMLCEFYCIV